MKTRYNRILWLIVVVAVGPGSRLTGASEPQLLPQDLLDQGWIQLFSGETLVGWQSTGEAKWEVVDGAIHTAGDKPGFLMTKDEFASFELHVEYRAPAATNSGVFLRSALEPTNPAVDCFELNIAPADNPFPTGSFVARKKSELPPDAFPTANEWHALDVTMVGQHFVVRLDGREVLLFDATTTSRGHIGLQSNQGEISFRSIRLRPIEPKAE